MIDTQFMTDEEVKANETLLTLMRRRKELALVKEITDMGKYIQAWDELAKQFLALGYKHNAAICTSNAERYAKENAGVVVIPVKEKEEVIVTIDNGTTIKFKDIDAMSGWLAAAMD